MENRSGRKVPPGKVAVSLALPDTETCLAALHELASLIGLAEIRLDLMHSFDLARLICSSPCPLIITCRPTREGGNFNGSETRRLEILKEAMRLGCAYVDVEWDSVAALAPQYQTRIIASRHWMKDIPAQLMMEYQRLREQGNVDVVKLAILPRNLDDVLLVFQFLSQASTPVIGLAMGESGRITRLLSPCFPHCFLTYAAYNPDALTAPGQFTIDDMLQRYNLNEVGPSTQVSLHLCRDELSACVAERQNSQSVAGKELNVSMLNITEDVIPFVSQLQAYLPSLRIKNDSLYNSVKR